jgi:hypothetical protein
MAHIPTIEEMLIEVRQGLGLKLDVREDEFSKLKKSLKIHFDVMEELLKGIFIALNMDEQDCRDVLNNLKDFAGFNKGLELNVWTGNACQQQVLWHLLAYSYVPYFARRLAFWAIANTNHRMPAIDRGMPGGKFWFLPAIDFENKTIKMPVAQVCEWLLDLLGDNSFYGIEEKIEITKAKKYEETPTERTLHNWRKGVLPKSASKIDELFDVRLELDFKGVFLPDTGKPLEEQFKQAITFINGKGLNNPGKFHVQIPMGLEKLQLILNGVAPDELKNDFVVQIATRYAKPSIHTIRQRLKIARMMQDGYERLLKYLCPNTRLDCTDPNQNKLIQLFGLFELIYNLTIDAYQNSPFSEIEQNVYFDSKLTPWDKADLLMSIAPSTRGKIDQDLPRRLTKIFFGLSPTSPLENLVAWDEESAKLIIPKRLELIKSDFDEEKRIHELHERIRVASPWRALLSENSFGVLSQLAQQPDFTPKIRNMVLKRIREIAETETQKVEANIIELDCLLKLDAKERPSYAKSRVQLLLDTSKSSAAYEEWKAGLLGFSAKHKLFQNDLKGAVVDFKQALEACEERAFGGLRGEIARDGFAAELVLNGFIPNNQEIYYRNMLAYMEWPNGPISIEDTAVECEDFYWDTLYQPYSDIEPLVSISKKQYQLIIEETTGIIFQADWNGLTEWLKKNVKHYRKLNFKDARRNSILLTWLKLFQNLNKNSARLRLEIPHQLISEFKKNEAMLQNWRKAILLLVEAWPEQAKIADFKNQTPLMLLAENGDYEFAKIFIPFSDINVQDNKGRTALHAAVMGNSLECVASILECEDIDLKKRTIEGNTALHMAVRFGLPEIVKLIIQEFPGLSEERNKENQTALEMAQYLLENLPGWQSFMKSQNQRLGSKEEYSRIISILETANS